MKGRGGRYAILGQRLVSPETRRGRPLCACLQVGRRGRLYAWLNCKDCRGTGGTGATEEHRPSRVCNTSSMREGM